MALRPDTIRPPAHVRKQAEGKVETWRHDRSRRIYKVTSIDLGSAHCTIITRTRRRRRTISKERLHRDFTRVALCACGRHHHVRRAHR